MRGVLCIVLSVLLCALVLGVLVGVCVLCAVCSPSLWKTDRSHHSQKYIVNGDSLILRRSVVPCRDLSGLH